MASAANVTLHWTAPGDDSLTGRAASYDLRYSKIPITAANFYTASRVSGMPVPSMPGTQETYTFSFLSAGLYYFALKTVDEVGNWSAMSNVISKSTATVDIPDGPGGVVTALQFSAPQPNPARSNTSFTLGLPQAADVHIAAFDIQGRLVKTLLSGQQPPGELRLSWNLDDSEGRRLAPGVYLVRARLGDEWFDRRVAVVR